MMRICTAVVCVACATANAGEIESLSNRVAALEAELTRTQNVICDLLSYSDCDGGAETHREFSGLGFDAVASRVDGCAARYRLDVTVSDKLKRSDDLTDEELEYVRAHLTYDYGDTNVFFKSDLCGSFYRRASISPARYPQLAEAMASAIESTMSTNAAGGAAGRAAGLLSPGSLRGRRRNRLMMDEQARQAEEERRRQDEALRQAEREADKAAREEQLNALKQLSEELKQASVARVEKTIAEKEWSSREELLAAIRREVWPTSSRRMTDEEVVERWNQMQAERRQAATNLLNEVRRQINKPAEKPAGEFGAKKSPREMEVRGGEKKYRRNLQHLQRSPGGSSLGVSLSRSRLSVAEVDSASSAASSAASSTVGSTSTANSWTPRASTIPNKYALV